MLQEDAWRIIPRTQDVANWCGSAMSADTISCPKLYGREWLKVVVAEEDRVNYGRKHQGMDRPVIFVVVAHCR